MVDGALLQNRTVMVVLPGLPELELGSCKACFAPPKCVHLQERAVNQKSGRKGKNSRESLQMCCNALVPQRYFDEAAAFGTGHGAHTRIRARVARCDWTRREGASVSFCSRLQRATRQGGRGGRYAQPSVNGEPP